MPPSRMAQHNKYMKRILITSMLLLAVITAYAYKAYCVVESRENGGYITLHFGDKSVRVKGEDGKDKRFNSYAEILNYMGKRGWAYKNVIVTTASLYNTIFEKEVENDEEAKEGFNIE